MKNEKLAEALNEISDRHIEEAASVPKKRHWPAAVAAILALAILVGVMWKPAADPQVLGPTFTEPPSTEPPSTEAAIDPFIQLQYRVAAPEYPLMAHYPTGYDDTEYRNWRYDQSLMHDQPVGYADNLQSYFEAITAGLAADTNGQNMACSPVNLYMALAMLAETTDGESRQQILDLLNADSIDALRTQAKHVWEGHYNADGLSTSILANSLWLDESYIYNEETSQLLADNYYASVFRGDLGSEEMDLALQSWLYHQTSGLLADAARNVEMDPETVLALVSTLYYQVQWQDKFAEKLNTDGTFHGTAGNTTATFMNTELSWGPYYWGEHFGAVRLLLENDSRMWLLLPDEGTTPEALLESGEALDFLAKKPWLYNSEWENQASIIVNLSVPKFDISSNLELSDQLKSLGITDIFNAYTADFSPIIPEDDGGWISQVKHATRVSIDEEGVTGAAFTDIMRVGAAQPPEEEIDFILDRPFLFIIESQDHLPLFVGIVNQIG